MISVTVNVGIPKSDEERWTLSRDEAADAVFQGFGLDENVDSCVVYVNLQDPGMAGAAPEPPA